MSDKQTKPTETNLVPQKYQRTDEEKAISSFFLARAQIEDLYYQIERKESHIKQIEKKFPIITNLYGQIKKRKRKTEKEEEKEEDEEEQMEGVEGGKNKRKQRRTEEKTSLTQPSEKEVRREGGIFKKREGGQEGTGFSRSDKI